MGTGPCGELAPSSVRSSSIRHGQGSWSLDLGSHGGLPGLEYWEEGLQASVFAWPSGLLVPIWPGYVHLFGRAGLGFRVISLSWGCSGAPRSEEGPGGPLK